MTAATRERPAVRHQEDKLPMQTQFTTPTFGDPRLPPRFWAKVNENGPIPAHRPDLGPCWQWTASLSRDGYGNFRVGNSLSGKSRTVLAHRWAYEHLVGTILSGLEADHLCRFPPCVYPAHIEPVTHQENILRGNTIAARHAARTHCAQGHLYDEANTYRWGGRRICRKCRAAEALKWWRRRAIKRTGAPQTARTAS